MQTLHVYVGKYDGYAYSPRVGSSSVHTKKPLFSRISIPVRDGILAGLAVFVIALSSLLLMDMEALRQQRLTIKDSLERTARTAAGLVDGDAHAEMVRSGKVDPEVYERLISPLVEFHRQAPEIAYLYTLVEKGGQLYFALDTATAASRLQFDREMKPSGFMESYSSFAPDEDAAEVQAVRNGLNFVSKKPFTDEYGTFLSALAPIRDSKGNVVASLGIDMSVADYESRLSDLKKTGFLSAVISGLTGILLGALVWWHARQALKHEQAKWQATREKVELEERDRRIIRSLGQIIYRHNFSTAEQPEKIDWEGETEALLGYKPDRMPQKTEGWLELIHPDDRSREGTAFLAAVRGNASSYDGEYRLRHANGRYIWVHDRCVILRDDSGAPLLVDGTLLDVTERKVSDERFRTVFEASTDPHMLVGRNRVIECNHATVEMLGLETKADVIRQPLASFWPDLDETASWETTVFRGLHRFEAYKKHISGELIPVDVTNTHLTISDEEVMLVVWHDLRKIKHAQRELAFSEKKYRELVEGLEQVVFQTNQDGHWMFLNPAWEETTGYRINNCLGRPVDPFIWPEDRDRVLKAWRVGRPDDQAFRIIGATGNEIWVEADWRPRYDSAGRQVGVNGTLTNITARRKTEQAMIAAKEAAETADRAKSEFLAVMSHEIRTPMNGVIGFAQLLGETTLTEQQREYVETVKGCGDTLLRLLNDILDFSKMESSRVELENRPFSIRQSASEVISLYLPAAAAKEVTLSAQIDQQVPDQFMGDSTRFRQVLLNLVGNAVKFTEHGWVELRVSLAPDPEMPGKIDHLKIDVLDSGIGMDEDAISRLFKPFSQADSSTTRRYGGTGLGLAISARVVELMGGKLSVMSEPGRGSCFSFTLPLRHPEPSDNGHTSVLPAEETQKIDLGLHPSLKILVAEDNAINRKVISRMLLSMGYSATLVGDGFECLEACEREEFDMIFMDVQMPGLDGFETTARLRASGKRTWIAALTAAAMPDDRLKCQIAGMNDYLTKPYRKADLEASIGRYLAARQAKAVR